MYSWKFSCLLPSQWFILDFSCVNSLLLCHSSYVETAFKHAMLGGWGLTDEKSYDAVSTKPSCKTFWQKVTHYLHMIQEWAIFLRDIQIWFLQEAVPLACHPSSRLKQSVDKHTVPGSGQVPSPVREPWNPRRHLARVGGGDGESKQGTWLGVFKVWWFSSSGQVFTLSPFIFLIRSWVH